MSPWIETDHKVAAARWLDESAVGLRGRPILDAHSTVSGALHRTQQPGLQPISGRTSVSATLGVRQLVQGRSGGVATVSGLIGWLEQIDAASSGRSQVSGQLLVGVGQFTAASSAGAATVSATLSVKPYSYISGSQAGDDWSPYEPTVPTGRDDGRTRRRFVPRSSGITNESNTWRP